jgi:RNA polymerase sigma factor (sigma-70 family)
MTETWIINAAPRDDQRITETVERDGKRLRNFIRRRVPDERDAEDILQDVFYELVEAYRLMKPVEQATAWLYRVARNRITDLFRKKKPESLPRVPNDEEGLEDLLPSADRGPEAAYARTVLVEELEAALEELPGEQRRAFVAHEIEGRSFREMAEKTGETVNTLVLRKHRAVAHLRERLESIYEEILEK